MNQTFSAFRHVCRHPALCGHLLRFAFKSGDLASLLPHFNIVAINERLRRFDGGLVVLAVKAMGYREFAVRTGDVSSVIGHGRVTSAPAVQMS